MKILGRSVPHFMIMSLFNVCFNKQLILDTLIQTLHVLTPLVVSLKLYTLASETDPHHLRSYHRPVW